MLLLLLALIAPTEQHSGTGLLALTLLLEEIGIGLLVAWGLTSLTLRLLKTSYSTAGSCRYGASSPCRGWPCSASRWPRPWAAAASSPFVGGLLIYSQTGSTSTPIWTAARGTAICSVVIWMVFGATLMPMLTELLHWQYWLYAAASLTPLRMLPVWLSLLGTGLKLELKLFIGWFGPRGWLASSLR